MIKRRQFLQAVASASAAPAAMARPAPQAGGGTGGEGSPDITLTVEDAAAEGSPGFFAEPEFAALRRLCDILAPAGDGAPGALEAGAPEFLDFLISKSPADRQELYQAGLEALNLQSALRFHKRFAELDAAEAADLLAPLRKPWSYEPPADPLVRFLIQAKHDVRDATVNSVQWIEAAARKQGRRRRGLGLYWYKVQ